MRKWILVCLCLTGMLTPALAKEPWSGTWQVTWPEGGAFVQIQQSGDTIHGSYRNGQGEIEASAHGSNIEGRIIQGDLSETFSATLSPDEVSFSGRTESGDWLSGLRLAMDDTGASQIPLDLASPRATLRSFLNAANLAREGHPQALAMAVDTINFGSSSAWSANGPKFQATEQLFHLIDLATFSLSSIPGDSTAQRVSLSLPTFGKQPSISVTLERGADGKWFIVMPPPEALHAMIEEHHDAILAADAFRELKSPRDTLLSFFDGMARWGTDGRAQALSTLDLSQIPDVLKTEQGTIVAQYLIRIIDRAGTMPLQSVPNSGARQQPFVYFEHPAGRIVIEPTGPGPEKRWQFSADTVRNARSLFAAVQSLPPSHALAPNLIPPSSMFAIRGMVETYAPSLLRDVAGSGRVEYWQLLGGLMTLAIMIAIALVVRKVAAWLFTKPAVSRHVPRPGRLALSLAIIPAFMVGAQIIPHLGLPAATRQYTVPIMGTFLIVIVTDAVWQLIGIVASIVDEYALRTETEVDNILITFVSGVTRLALLATAGLLLGGLWSLPTSGILAGLGVGGIAVAFASKETLANVFGAGILLGDRPFKKGDRIRTGDVSGWVEAVGLRSTRIRTLNDSLVIVPNGKLADSTIDNLGARRRRALWTKIVVTSGGTPDTLMAFTQAIAARMTSDPLFDQYTEVNIAGITDNGIEIEISSSLNTAKGYKYRAAAHLLFLDIMKMAEAEGLTVGRGMEKDPIHLVRLA